MIDVDALRAELRHTLAVQGTPERAAQQTAYMKGVMPFYGVPMDAVRTTAATIAKKYPPANVDEWRDTALAIWRGAARREELYFAETWTGLRTAKKWHDSSLLPMYREMALSGAWWDVVDWIAVHRVGPILLEHRAATAPVLLAWANGDALWLRRVAILAQNHHRGAADWDFQQAVMAPSLSSTEAARKAWPGHNADLEFFLRKGIGWALREYAKVEPARVVAYVAAHKHALSGLSRREALKHAPPDVRAELV